MMPPLTATDRNGAVVQVGTLVKIVSLRPEFIKQLPQNERSDVTSMVGKVLAVYEIDEYGAAWVEQVWGNGVGGLRSHSIALDADEMEIA